jgi:hypothetical protein
MTYYVYDYGFNHGFRKTPMVELLVFIVEKRCYIGSNSVYALSTRTLHYLKKWCRKKPKAVNFFLSLVSGGIIPMKVDQMKGMVLTELRHRKAEREQNTRSLVGIQRHLSSCNGKSYMPSARL